MTTHRILFVEDNPGQRMSFGDAVSEWNAMHPERQLSHEVAEDAAQGAEHLETMRFDCALFDLRLPNTLGGPQTFAAGNELARTALEQYGIPVAIISGDPAELDQSLQRLNLIKSFNKGDPDAFQQALAWFGDRWRMMDTLAVTRSQIERLGADIFARRIWPKWSEYEALTEDGEDRLDLIVTRQYVSHLSEVLGTEDDANPGWHPFETYLRPALQETRAHTGDIFRLDDGELWIVVTAQCDMATQKVANALLAHCERAIADWETKVLELRLPDLSAKRVDSRDRYFSKLINQVEPASHFLPPLARGEMPLIVDFTTLRTVALEALNGQLVAREASVAAPFLPNLTQRFASYMGRPGQPNINARFFA